MANFIEIDYSELKGVAEAFRQAPAIAKEELFSAMQEADALVATQVESFTPVDTGLLASSITHIEQVSESGMIGVVFSPLNYVEPVELGTKPHVIEARNMKALSFMLGGKKITVKRVQHPGTKGAFMFRRGLDYSKAEIEAIFGRALDRITRRLAGKA